MRTIKASLVIFTLFIFVACNQGPQTPQAQNTSKSKKQMAKANVKKPDVNVKVKVGKKQPMKAERKMELAKVAESMTATTRPKTFKERIELVQKGLMLEPAQVKSIRELFKNGDSKRKECSAKSDDTKKACWKEYSKEYRKNFLAVLEPDQKKQFGMLAKEKKAFIP